MLEKLLITLDPFIKLGKTFNKKNIVKRRDIFIVLLKLALFKRFGQTRKEVTVRLPPFKVISPDYETLSFLVKEKFVYQQYYFEESNTSPIIFDCGSSIGISVLYFKNLYPGSVIYAFEPNPSAFYFLQHNVSSNNLTNTHCYNLALSNKKDTVDFFIPKERSFINAKTVQQDLTEFKVTRVSSVPLSEFLLTFSEVHVVKIDVEGSEVDIMEDLKMEVLKRKIVKKFIIEFHTGIHTKESTLHDFLATFTDSGYRWKFIKTQAKEKETDKLIMAYLQE